MPAGNVPVTQPNHPPGLDTRELFDNGRVIEALALKSGERVLDIGCGRGGWALLLAQQVGDGGAVYAFDRRPGNVTVTRTRAQAQGIGNLHVWQGDAALALPLPDQSVDFCLLSMVLHHLVEHGVQGSALREIRRVLKSGGRLAVLEFEKIDPPPGPPKTLRLDREQTRSIVASAAARYVETLSIESHVYLQQFSRQERRWNRARPHRSGKQPG